MKHALTLATSVWFLGACRAESGAPLDAGQLAGDTENGAPAEGAVVVAKYDCGQCHQSSDPRDGVLSGQTMPVPGTHTYGSNLTPDPDTGMDAWDAGTIASAILRATGIDGGHLCPTMPAYADAGMTPAEAQAIALYLQSLPAVWHRVPSSACPAPSGAGGDGG
jgi:hypothetical protein